MLQGKKKARKTYALAGIAAAYLGEKECIGFSARGTAGKLLWVDTEQAPQHCSKVIKRVLKAAGLTTQTDRLFFSELRAHAPGTRLAYLSELIEELKPDFVIVDGVRDLAIDPVLDAVQASEIITFLLEITTRLGCHVLCALHQNGANDRVRGHIGTELENKSEGVWEVSKADNLLATPTKIIAAGCRNAVDGEVYFLPNLDDVPEACEGPNSENVPRVGMGLLAFAEICKQVLGADSVPRGELEESLKQGGAPKRTETLRALIAEAMEGETLIVVGVKGAKTARYKFGIAPSPYMPNNVSV